LHETLQKKITLSIGLLNTCNNLHDYSHSEAVHRGPLQSISNELFVSAQKVSCIRNKRSGWPDCTTLMQHVHRFIDKKKTDRI